MLSLSETQDVIARTDRTVDSIKRIVSSSIEGMEEDARQRSVSTKEQRTLENLKLMIERTDEMRDIVEGYKNAHEGDPLLYESIDVAMRVTAQTGILDGHRVLKESNALLSAHVPPVVLLVAMKHLRENPAPSKYKGLKSIRKSVLSAVKEWDQDNLSAYPEEVVSEFLVPWLKEDLDALNQK